MSNLVGKTLGKYRVVARLGQGGMATVFKAVQPSLDRYVAIKVLLGHLAQESDFAQRFLHEATAVARLRHPNIVTVFDFDVVGDQPYMVMEFISGPTLSEEIKTRQERQKPFTLLEIAKIMASLADAIDYAHQQGTIHRDIKPSNIMLTPGGDVVLTDFGIARLMDNTQTTVTNTVVGTPAYMSPEQGLGEAVDHRSDLYALGVILFELITGRVPYQAETPLAVMMHHVSSPIPDPTQLVSGLPETVARVIIRALDKDPEKRYQTATDMIGELLEAIAPDSIQALNVIPLAYPSKSHLVTPTPSRFNHSDQKHKRWLVPGTVLMIFLALLLGGTGGWWLFGSSAAGTGTPSGLVAVETGTPDPTATAAWLIADDDRDGLSNGRELELNTLSDKRDTDEDGIDDGDEILIWQTDPLVPDTDRDGLKDGVELERGLDPTRQDSDSDGTVDARDPDPIRPPTSTPTIVPLPTRTRVPDTEPTASPVAESLKTATTPATASPTPSATAIPLPTATAHLSGPALPQLQGWLVFERTGAEAPGVYALDLETGEALRIHLNGRSPQISRDGNWVTWEEAGGLAIFNMARTQRSIVSEDQFDEDPAISSTGQKIAYVNKNALYIWENGISRNLTVAEQQPAWSPDDQRLLITGRGGDIYQITVSGPSQAPMLISQNSFSPSWGVNGKIAFERNGDIYIMEADGSEQKLLIAHAAPDYDPAWSPDGAHLVFISERDGNPEIYVVDENGRNLRRLTTTLDQAEASPSWGNK